MGVLHHEWPLPPLGDHCPGLLKDLLGKEELVEVFGALPVSVTPPPLCDPTPSV